MTEARDDQLKAIAGHVVSVGLPETTVDALRSRLDINVVSARSAAELARGLEGASVVILDDRTGGALERIHAISDSSRGVRIFVCIEPSRSTDEIRGVLSESGVARLFLHPVDVDELAFEVSLATRRRGADAVRETVAAGLADLWEQYREVNLLRIAELEEAVRQFLSGSLDADAQAAAARQAHKLAGALGSFGFSAAGQSAVEIESLLEQPDPDAARLAQLVVALRKDLDRPIDVHSETIDRRPVILIVSSSSVPLTRLQSELTGFRIIVTKSFREARELASERSVAMFVVDLESADGVERANTLVAELGAVSEIPIAVAAHSDLFIHRLATARLGAQAYLRKPIEASELKAVASRLIPTAAPAYRILAVDDDRQVLDQVRSLLARPGIDLVTIDDPLELWRELASHQPDLVLLDVEMPYVSGIELCRVMRSDDRWRRVPVIFLTARRDAATFERIFAAGADDFIGKPVNGRELSTRVFARLDRIAVVSNAAGHDAVTGLPLLDRAIWQVQLSRSKENDAMSAAAVAVTSPHAPEALKELNFELTRGLSRTLKPGEIIAAGEGALVLFSPQSSRELTLRLSEACLSMTSGEPFATVGAHIAVGIARGEGELGPIVDAAISAMRLAGEDEERNVSIRTAGENEQEVRVDVAVVEDDESSAAVLLHALENAGYTTHWFRDGALAADQLLRGAIRARLVVLDVDLPGVNGMTLLRRLREAGELRRMRVIVVTVRSAEADVLASFELGAVDHVAKPFNVSILMHRVRRGLA